MLVKDAVTDPPKKRKKVVVLAEAPLIPKYDSVDDVINGDVDPNTLPKSLRDIYYKYEKDVMAHGELQDKLMNVRNSLVEKYAKNHPGVPLGSIPNQDFEEQIAIPALTTFGEENQQKLQLLRESLDKLNTEFTDPKINPRVRQSTFLVEAENIKDFYKGKDVDVEIIPFYKGDTDESKVKTSLKNTKPDDKVVFLGHKGDVLGGYSHQEMSNILKDATATDCYLGSCDFENYINNYSDLKGKNIYYRPNSKYLGVTPKADTFLDAMYGRVYDQNNAPTITPSQEGINYAVKKF